LVVAQTGHVDDILVEQHACDLASEVVHVGLHGRVDSIADELLAFVGVLN